MSDTPAQSEFFQSSPLGMVLVGSDCIITAANAAAERLSGWSHSDLAGRVACSELLSAPGAVSQPQGCAGLCRRGAPSPDGSDAMRPALLAHVSGQPVPVLVASAPMAETGGWAFWLHDASDSAQLQAEAALRRRQAEGLMAIGRELAAFRDPSSGMDRILDQACRLFGMDLCAWGLMDESALQLTWQASRGAGSERVRGAVQPLAHLLMGEVLRSGRPFITHNLAGQGAATDQHLFADPPMKSAIAVAFRLEGALSGVLLGASTQVLALTDNDMQLFAHLGSYMATAAENAQLLSRVQHLAVLEERQRLAREMHDSFGQMLTYLGLRHYLIERAAQAGNMAAILKETASLKQVLQEAHTEIRQNIFRLKESGQPRASWVDRWRQSLQEFEARTGTRTRFDVWDGVPGHLPEQVDLQLTRILQEALTNIANHAGALCVTVRLACEEGTLRITIADDGCGFEPARAEGPKQQHFGLTIMQERAGAVGARLQLRSMRGYGTTISIQLPLGEGTR